KGVPPLPGGVPSASTLGGGNVINVYATNLSAPWGVAFDTAAADFWVSNSVLFAGDKLDYRFTTDGTQTSDTIDDSGWIADWAADGAYDPRAKKLWSGN